MNLITLSTIDRHNNLYGKMYNVLNYFFSSLIIIIIQRSLSTDTCIISKDKCNDLTWSPWGTCNRTCGLGYMSRKRDICCENKDERRKCKSYCRLQQNDKIVKETKKCMGICHVFNQIKSGNQRIKKTRNGFQKLRYRRNTIGCEMEPMDIFFLIDSSGSVEADNFNKTMLFISNFVRELSIGPSKTQVGLATYAFIVVSRFSLNQHTNQKALINAIKHIPYESGGTYTGQALQWVDQNAFSSNHGGRSHAKKVLIVMTDGQSTNTSLTLRAAKYLHRHQIVVYGIGIGAGVDVIELSAIASDQNHKIILSGFDDFQKLQNKFKSKECLQTTTPRPTTPTTTPPTTRTTKQTTKKTAASSKTQTTEMPLKTSSTVKVSSLQTFVFNPNSRQCLSSPCNQGTCIPIGSDFLCLCQPGYIGPMCDIDEDDCQKEPCVYGQCEDKVNGYTCKCSSLFYGKNCDKMKFWAIMMISIGIFTMMTMSCCCVLCLPSCRRKKDEKEDKRNHTPPTKRPEAWTY